MVVIYYKIYKLSAKSHQRKWEPPRNKPFKKKKKLKEADDSI